MKTKPTTKSIIIIVLLHVILITGNSSAQTFTRIDTGRVCTAGGYSYAGSFGDFNNDGLDDLYITRQGFFPGASPPGLAGGIRGVVWPVFKPGVSGDSGRMEELYRDLGEGGYGASGTPGNLRPSPERGSRRGLDPTDRQRGNGPGDFRRDNPRLR